MNILNKIQKIELKIGHHADTAQTGSGCFMNVASYLNGDTVITDDSDCVCASIRPLVRWANDFASNEQRKRLLPYVLRAMGTKTNDVSVIVMRARAAAKFAEKMKFIAAADARYAAADAARYAAAAADAADAAAADAADAARGREKIFQAFIQYMEEVCNKDDLQIPDIATRADKLVKAFEAA